MSSNKTLVCIKVASSVVAPQRLSAVSIWVTEYLLTWRYSFFPNPRNKALMILSVSVK